MESLVSVEPERVLWCVYFGFVMSLFIAPKDDPLRSSKISKLEKMMILVKMKWLYRAKNVE